MPKASDIKRGDIVKIDGQPHAVEQLEITTPSARGATSLYHFRFRNLTTKQKADRTLKGEATLDPCDFHKRDVQFSYIDGQRYVFMDNVDYSELVLHAEDIEDEIPYLTEDMEDIKALFCDGRCVAIELPPVAELDVTACDPSVRGASATARTKPATLSTGLVVQVPEYLSPGERVRVDTRTGKFLGRA